MASSNAPNNIMETLTSFVEMTLKPSAPVFIIGAMIVILFPILLHIILHRATPYTSLPSILLVGPSGAGKTALLTVLERGPLAKASPVEPAALTHTSQVPAAVELATTEDATSSYRDDLDAAGATAKKFLLIDTPGHGKLRRHALSRLDFASNKAGRRAAPVALPSLGTTTGGGGDPDSSKLRGVVFVVDAAALAEPDVLAATASYLYDVLLALQKRAGSGRGSRPPPAVPVLVAANKADLFTALPAALVRSQLEGELARIRHSRSKGLLDSGIGTDVATGAAEEADDWLGQYGSEKFAFAQMREFDIEVDVFAGNVLGEGPGIDRWWKWIAKRI